MTTRIWKGWGKEWEYRGARTYVQQVKFKGLVNDGLKPYQAKHFIFYNFKHAYMRRFRAAVRRGEAGRSQASAWALFRKIYNDAIEKARRGDRGGYTEPPRRTYDPSKPHKKLKQDGTIDYSHSREYERKRRTQTRDTMRKSPPSGDASAWIRQLEQSILNTNNPQRIAQLQAQIDRLKRRQR